MSEEPKPGDNLAHVNKLTSEMQHHAGLWSRDVGQAEKHEREILVRAYELCLWAASDQANDDLLVGRMARAGVPQTKRSQRCTQTVQYAFAKIDKKPEPSQLSRWGWAIQHALDQNPRPPPSDLLAFIKREGGDAECRKKARAKAKKNGDADPPEDPKPYRLPCELPDVFDGQMVKVEKTAEGEWQVIPRKVLSFDTTLEQEAEPAPAAPH
jgi:hypothetical protein